MKFTFPENAHTSWRDIRPGEVAQWQGSGDSIVVMKLKGEGFVNLATAAITQPIDVANSPWKLMIAEMVLKETYRL